MRALVRAERFAVENPERARQIASEKLGMQAAALAQAAAEADAAKQGALAALREELETAAAANDH